MTTLATTKASEEVVKYLTVLLRESLEPCVLSDATLFELVEQGCRTKADVAALTKQAIVNLATTEASEEVVKYLTVLLRQSWAKWSWPKSFLRENPGIDTACTLSDATLVALVE